MHYINQNKTPSLAARRPKYEGYYSFKMDDKIYNNVSTSQTLGIFRDHCKRLKGKMDYYEDYQWELTKLKLESVTSYVMVGVSDFFSGASAPSTDMWDPIHKDLDDAIHFISQNNVEDTWQSIEKADIKFVKAAEIFNEYLHKNDEGYESTIKRLELVRDTSAMIISVYAGSFGLVAGAAGGALYKLAQTTAQSGMEVHINLKDKMDWLALGEDCAIDFIFKVAAGKVAGKFIRQLKDPKLLMQFPTATQKVIFKLIDNSYEKVKKKFAEFILGKMGDVIGICIKDGLDKLKNSHSHVTWDSFTDKIADKFSIKELSLNTVEAILGLKMDKE